MQLLASSRFKRQTGPLPNPNANNNTPTFFDSLVSGDGQPPARVRFAANPFQQFPQGPYLYDPFGFERARLYEAQRQALIERLRQQELLRQQQPQQQIFVPPPAQSSPILIPPSDSTALQQAPRVVASGGNQDAETEALLSSIDFKTADPKALAAYLKANPQVVQALNSYWDRKLNQGRGSPDQSLTLGEAARLLEGK